MGFCKSEGEEKTWCESSDVLDKKERGLVQSIEGDSYNFGREKVRKKGVKEAGRGQQHVIWRSDF
jgi:hypothetical protein